MRLAALLLSLMLLALAGWTGWGLWQRLTMPAPAPQPLAALLPDPRPGADGARAPLRPWPPLFGEPQPPAPPAPPVQAEPQPPTPPTPPMPPIDSLGYRLKGVVRTGQVDWAIVTHPTGELLLRVGDPLTEDLTVEAIDAQGMWVSNGDTRMVLGFESQSQ